MVTERSKYTALSPIATVNTASTPKSFLHKLQAMGMCTLVFRPELMRPLIDLALACCI